jgi:hydroxymethylbilane synthase
VNDGMPGAGLQRQVRGRSARSLRIGTRGSALALAQTGMAADALRVRGIDAELVIVETEGDRRAPDTAWGEGAFVTAIESALREGRIDVAVHSAKDVPVREDDGLHLAAFLPRADPADALVLPAGAPQRTLADLPEGARVGTDSPRRTGFVLALRPDLRLHPLHGNVDTRLRRLDDGETDALVLAVAGLARLGRMDRISERLAPELVPPAPGQGAVALQCRGGDPRVRDLLAAADDPATRLAVETERGFLARAGGGCRAPIGALAQVQGDRLSLLAGYARPDGGAVAIERRDGPAAQVSAMIDDLVIALDRRVPGVRSSEPEPEPEPEPDATTGRSGAEGSRPAAAASTNPSASGGATGRPAVLVTRPAEQADGLVEALRDAGMAAPVVPAIEIRPVPPGGLLDASVAALPAGAWVVVTSTNGVDGALEAARRSGRDPGDWRWAAVGRTTAERLRTGGVEPVWLPPRAAGRAIAEGLPVHPGDRVLLARGDLASADLPDVLRARGAVVEERVAYQTIEAPESSVPVLRRVLGEVQPSAVLALSGSAIRGLLALAERLGPDALARIRATPVICIGPETAAVATAHGLLVLGTAGMQQAPVLAGLALDLLRSTSSPQQDEP